MNKDDIARMARESGGLPDPMVFIGAYERFAHLVAAAEREQPEQEPVAKLFGTLPVYDTPPAAQRKPLTDEEIEKLYKRSAGYGGDDFHSFARAIEAAHGIEEGT